ncbi:MAG: hypothetical protein AB1648_15200 [Pseudomonadota bacterium]
MKTIVQGMTFCTLYRIAMNILGCCTVLLATVPVSAEVDFSKLDDILQGDRTLLRTDDLVFSGNLGTSLGPTHISFMTSQSKVTNSYREDLGSGRIVWNGTLALGRIFNLPFDVIADVTSGGDSQVALLTDPVGGGQITDQIDNENAVADYATTVDLNYDGYDELVVHTGLGKVFVGTAKDINNMSSGLKWHRMGGDEFRGTSAPHAFAVIEFVEPAAKAEKRKKAFLMAKATPEGKLILNAQVVDPLTLEGRHTILVSELKLPGTGKAINSLSLVVGRFGALDHDQLLLAYSDAVGAVRAVTYDLSPSRGYVGKNVLDLGKAKHVVVKKGHLNGLGTFDQAVVWLGDLDHPGPSSLSVLTFDQNLNIANPAKASFSPECFSDLAVGRFDSRQKQDANAPDFNQQVAILWRPNCKSSNDNDKKLLVAIYDVDARHAYKISHTSSYYEPINANVSQGQLVAGDLSGRSLRLGSPVKLTSSETSYQVALQSPPMHVDWAVPMGGFESSVLNLSAAPDQFFTTYSSSSTTTVAASYKKSVGAAWGRFFKGDGAVGVGWDSENFFAAQTKLSIQRKTDVTNDSLFSQDKARTDELSAGSGYSDMLWYSSTVRYSYIYPVLGQSMCPDSAPNCGESEKGPMVIELGVDKVVKPVFQAGSGVEWYQPVTEPGNVFSYPNGIAQLSSNRINPGFQALTEAEPSWVFTDGIPVDQAYRWDRSANSEKTLATTKSWNREAGAGIKSQISKTVHVEADILAGVTDDELDKTEDTSSTSLSRSTGITLSKGSQVFPDPGSYKYSVQAYIFGRKRPEKWPDFSRATADLRTNGPIQVGYNVDLQSAGGWWERTYTLPDVALNHPSRWRIEPQAVNDEAGTACRGDDCAVFNEADVKDVWNSQFYWMRGFFVTRAGATPAQTMEGSLQKSDLTAGERVSLRARVYNYSLVGISGAGRVKVRFYGQRWNRKGNQPSGESFLIEEKTYSSIPGFGTFPTDEMNWIWAETEFDPSPYVNQELVFWMVVWLEDGKGQKAAEMADHGLNNLPGDLKTMSQLNAGEGGLLERHSNNVGVYRYAFHVFPAKNAASLATAEMAESLDADVLASKKKAKLRDKTKVVKFRVTPRRSVFPGDTVIIELILKNLDVPVELPTDVYFFDSDPDMNPEDESDAPFESERISYMGAYEKLSVEVPYVAERCGKNVLYAVVPERNIKVKTRFNVICR